MEQLVENHPSSVQVLAPQGDLGGEVQLSKEAMHDQLDAARRDWAAMSAKRQRRLFDRQIHGYNKTRDTYESLLVECQKLDLADALEAESDETQRRLMTAEYWLSEQNLLREETKKTVEGKKTWKFAHAFSEFLNSGSPRMRMLKGIALGVGVGVAGSMLGGVLGAATIGTGIVAAGRFARGYFARHKGGIEQHSVGAEDLLQHIGHEDLDEAAFHAAIQEESREMFNRDGKKEQNKQRVAFAWGAGAVAVGAAAGWAVAGGHWGFLSSAHAETISHHDVTDVSSGQADVTAVEPGHQTVTTVEGSHSDVLAAESTHHDVTDIADNHASVSTVESSHHDVTAVESGHDDVTAVGDHANDIETVKGETFTVERGSGLTREIYQYARHMGYKDISLRDSYRIYQLILEEHGKNGIINVHGIGQDTYLFDGHDVRISAPGEANWRSGVSEDLQRLFQAHESGHRLTSSILEHGNTDVSGHATVSEVGGADLPNASAEDISHAGHADVTTVESDKMAQISHAQVTQVGSSDLSNASASDIRNVDSGTLNIRNSVVAEAEQILRQGAGSPVNIVSNTETWYHTFSELNKAGIMIPKENYAKLLNVVGPELSELHYNGTMPVAYYDDYAHQWMMNQSPNGRLLPAAVRLIAKHLTKDGYVLAS